MLPRLRSLVREVRTARAARAVIDEWRREVARPLPASSERPARAGHVVILPGDPVTVVGSRGDEAMIGSVLAAVRAHDASLPVSIVTAAASPAAAASAERLGCRPLPLWGERDLFERFGRACADAGFLLVVGGDVMDGYYSPIAALHSWLLADLAARRGVRSVVLGCSFNERPSRWLAEPLDALSPEVDIHVRDPVSLARFRRFSRARAELSADLGFLLPPGPDCAEVASARRWAEARRREGGSILGFNVHPMLLMGAEAARLGALLDAAERALGELLAAQPVSVLLIPHDFRAQEGDLRLLAPIAAALGRFGERVSCLATPLSAAQLKAAAGIPDAVVTGRMHLGVAALGQGRPIGAVTYQGKFQGLLEHFGLPPWLVVEPSRSGLAQELYALMVRLLGEREALARQVSARLAGVIELSRRNLSFLAP